MWKKYLFLLLPLCLPPRVPAAEQWYLASESQLRSIEQSLESWEADRLNWESRARSLSLGLEASQKEAANLNAQLETERERFGKLEASFNKLEASRQEELGRMAAEKRKAELKTKSVENQRNILAAALCAVLVIWLRVFFIRRKM